jgi:hypothetical protein
MRFLLESSRVPIYERINYSIKLALEELGHEVIFFASDFPTDQEYLEAVNNLNADVYFLSNEGARAHKYSDVYGQYLFEKLKHKLIFLCHDNMFCGTESTEKLKIRYEALASVSMNSRIFCIEDSNISDLSKLGIKNIFRVNHATEFRKNSLAVRDLPVSFVGHTMAGLMTFPIELFKEASNLREIALKRLSDCTFSVQSEIDKVLSPLGFENNFINRQYLLNILNKMTFSYRGDLLNSIDEDLVIFGGDLSYGKGDPVQYIIPSEKIKYLPATQDYRVTSDIYRRSKININITGFQFDTAITNRVLDVIAAGGIIFTDYKTNFIEEFPFASELLYENSVELKEKVSRLVDPEYIKLLDDICSQLREIIYNKFSYKNILNQIVGTL